MGSFAKIENNIVTNVIVADQEFIDSKVIEGVWVETCYDGSFRKKYACIGDSYLPEYDVFIGVSPYPSWVLNSNHDWEAPIPLPEDNLTGNPPKNYEWDESLLNWIEVKSTNMEIDNILNTL